MFKIIGRILVILLVTGLVAGGLYLLVENGGNATAFTPERQFEGRTFDRARGGANPPLDGNFARPERFGDHGPEGAFSLGRGLLEMLGILLKMGVIVAIVLLIQGGFSRLTQRNAARAG